MVKLTLIRFYLNNFYKTFSFVYVDRDTFKQILTFVNDNHLNRIKAIIWNIDPKVREDEVITKQAQLINMFKPKDIWNNVIIICKKVTLI